MTRWLITTYAKLGHGNRADAQAPLPPPPQPLREEANEEKEADDISLNFYEFLDVTQEGEVALADLQAAIAVSFES
jgi:hypothetical protein